MQHIIDVIITIEWEMFDKVDNVSGRAACQDNERTFRIMRGSQFEAWDDATLESYLRDLQSALAEGRNLLTEKYAHMMEYTAPLEFRDMEDRLPKVPVKKKELIRKITRQQLAWHERIASEFPLLVNQGRPIHTAEESMYDTSVETYMIGELTTYSMDTLRAYESYMEKLAAEGKNLSRMTLENTAKAHGYASLEEAEAALKSV